MNTITVLFFLIIAILMVVVFHILSEEKKYRPNLLKFINYTFVYFSIMVIAQMMVDIIGGQI